MRRSDYDAHVTCIDGQLTVGVRAAIILGRSEGISAGLTIGGK
jgi:hypothetical protein